MLHRWTSLGLIGGSLIGILVAAFDPTAAHAANLDQCGGIFLRNSDARCEFRTEEHCSATCSYGSVQSSCVAQIYERCERECTEVPSEQCEIQCRETCTSECAKPIEEDLSQVAQCEALCDSDCQLSCTDPCGKCDEACLYTCSDKCTEQCRNMTADSQPAECDTTCTTACTASCTAKANSQCQIDCQNRVFEDCEPTLVERCLEGCETQVGAIFCDGQYLDSSDVEECAAEIDSEAGIQVDRSDIVEKEPSPMADGTSSAVNGGSCALTLGVGRQSVGSGHRRNSDSNFWFCAALALGATASVLRRAVSAVTTRATGCKLPQ
ncbi:MAG TPA: hypothetical protein VHO25_07660 [Polyangiaceae bacterium]|nr:hypothetical protein [Polyangiaceae bacterium]